MFWGITVEPEKKYSQVASNSFHVSMAALEPLHEVQKKNRHVSVMIEHQKSEYMLCTLEHGGLHQQPLNLNFVEGEEVCFYTIGQGTVHLTGYHGDDDCDNSLMDEDDFETCSEEESELSENDDSSEDEDIPTLVSIDNDELSQSDDDDEDWVQKSKKRKKSSISQSKKLKLESASIKESNVSGDVKQKNSKSNENASKKSAKKMNGKINDSTINSSKVSEKSKNKKNDSSLKEDSRTKRKSEKPKQNGEAVQYDDDDNDDDDDDLDSSDEVELVDSSLEEMNDESDSPGDEEEEEEDDDEDDELESDDSEDEVEDKNTKFKSMDIKPKLIADKSITKSPATLKDDGKASNTSKTITGGTMIKDLRIGKGPAAGRGRVVHVYYVGKLSNGSKFDSLTSGKPFKFRLGNGDVIKGWDMGLQGMKVGGKREIIVPPSQGYGKKKVGKIPGNSTLHFDVELKAVN